MSIIPHSDVLEKISTSLCIHLITTRNNYEVVSESRKVTELTAKMPFT